MSHDFSFVPLLLVTLLAVAVPVLVSRMRSLRLPIVVGEILAGMVLGKSGLNLLDSAPTLTFLADFGFVFLMFLSGLEVSIDVLAAPAGRDGGRPRWQGPLPLALAIFGLTVALAAAIGAGMGHLGLTRSPILMGLILSTTSLGIVVPILKERGLTATIYGQTVLVSALVSDFATLLLLSLAIAAAGQGLSPELLLFMALLAAFVVAAQVGRRMTRMPLLARLVDELSHATAQIHVRGALALMVMWVVLAQAMGLEVILGAFLAGAILSVSMQGQETPLHDKLDTIGYGFFIPIFFISVGSKFDLRALLASPTALLLVPGLIVVVYLVKLLPALLLRSRFSWRETLAAGSLLSSRLSLIIAASAIALELGLITPATDAAMILVAIVTCTVSPMLFLRILPPAGSQREGVVVLGCDHLAALLGQRLRQVGEAVTYVGNDREQLAHLEAAGYRALFADPPDERVLALAGLDKARALIVVANGAEMVISACRLAHERFLVPAVIARADLPQLVQELEALGVRVIQPAMATAMAMEGALHFPAAFRLLAERSPDVGLADALLTNPALAGRPLRQVRLPGDVLVVGIHRRGEVLVPHGDTVLERGDSLVLLGGPASLPEARSWLGEPGR